jgi:hypothetical protein
MKRLTIELARKIADKKGGFCLSDKYINNHNKLIWKCGSCDYVWNATLHNVKDQHQWCPRCAGNLKHDIKIVKEWLIKNKPNSQLLSTNYINSKSDLKFRCKKGHVWNSTFGRIKSGKWCPKCAKPYSNCNILDMKKLAIKRGGLCLSEKYENSTTKLKWQCKHNHIWEAIPSQVVFGTWCPYCKSSSRSEEICRVYFEEIFKTKFPRSYPFWLKSNLGYQMELDGYSEKLGVAFEHNGLHHYEDIEFWKNKKEYWDKNDSLKKELCSKYNVKLVIIPALFVKTKLNNLLFFIKEQCNNLDIDFPNITDLNVDLSAAYKNNNIINKYKYYARSKGGDLLSDSYINSQTKMKWVCKNGHIWEASTNSVQRNHWCSECYGNKKFTIQDAKKLAIKRNGKCLSSNYINSKTHLEWMCNKCNHIWFARFDSVKRGTWCPKCRRKYDY